MHAIHETAAGQEKSFVATAIRTFTRLLIDHSVRENQIKLSLSDLKAKDKIDICELAILCL
jgi:hypothetical protein